VATATLLTAVAHAGELQTASIGPIKDNSLVEIDDGSLSLALSEFILAGRVGNVGGNQKLRRGLIAFDVAAALPPDATVQSVQLSMFCVMTNSGDHPVSLHSALEDWGEGSSFGPGGAGAPATPGDATWLHTFWPGALWTVEGGTFAEAPSATTTVGLPGAYAWSSPGLVADVQSWLDSPAVNFGWMVIGGEPVVQSVKAFASRENIVVEQRPVLTITYTLRATIVGDLDDDGMVSSSDLALLLGAWGRCGAPCAADLDRDGFVGAPDLSILLGAWSL